MTQTSARPGHPPRWALAALLAALATLGPFSIDTYLPSFPAMGTALAASPAGIQQTLSGYLGGYALMMLFHGALSDAFGRRPVILVSLFVYLVASLACALATTLPQLVLWRVVQGLSAGAGMVVGRAMIRDVFEGSAAQKLMAMVTMIFGLAPAVAPIVGGWLHQAFGWRSHFFFLALLAAVLIAVCWRKLPETLPAAQRQRFAVAPLAAAYRRVGANGRFLLLSTAIALNFCGFFVYVVSAPAFIYGILGLGETQFAWLFVPGISGVVLGAWLSGRLAGRVSPRATVRIGYTIMFAAVAVNVAGNLLFAPAVPWAVLPVMGYTVGMSLAMPSVSLIALDLFPHNRGMASSLQGFEHSAATAILAGAVAPIVSGSGLAMAIGAVCMLVAGWVCWMAYLSVEARRHTGGRA